MFDKPRDFLVSDLEFRTINRTDIHTLRFQDLGVYSNKLYSNQQILYLIYKFLVSSDVTVLIQSRLLR